MSRQQRPIDEIAPSEWLKEKWGTTEPEAAIEMAEAARTSSDPPHKRCPACRSRRVFRKSNDHQPQKVDTDWVCHNCQPRYHFEEPIVGDPDGGCDWVDADDLEAPPLRRQLAALDDDALAALAILLYRPWNHAETDPSYRDLASVFPYSRVWIGDHIRAWKAGDRRDLVAAPRVRVDLSAGVEEVEAE